MLQVVSPACGGDPKTKKMNEEKIKQKVFDVVSVPMTDSDEKEKALDVLNSYFRSGYILVDKYTSVEQGLTYLCFEMLSDKLKKQVRSLSGEASVAQVTTQSGVNTIVTGLGVPFSDVITGHKQSEENSKTGSRPKLEDLYKGDKEKLYMYYSIAVERLKKAIADKVHIFSLFSNAVIQAVIDNGYKSKDDLSKIPDLKRDQFKKCGDLISNTVQEVLLEVEKGIDDETINKKEAEWHSLVKEHTNIMKNR